MEALRRIGVPITPPDTPPWNMTGPDNGKGALRQLYEGLVSGAMPATGRDIADIVAKAPILGDQPNVGVAPIAPFTGEMLKLPITPIINVVNPRPSHDAASGLPYPLSEREMMPTDAAGRFNPPLSGGELARDMGQILNPTALDLLFLGMAGKAGLNRLRPPPGGGGVGGGPVAPGDPLVARGQEFFGNLEALARQGRSVPGMPPPEVIVPRNIDVVLATAARDRAAQAKIQGVVSRIEGLRGRVPDEVLGRVRKNYSDAVAAAEKAQGTPAGDVAKGRAKALEDAIDRMGGGGGGGSPRPAGKASSPEGGRLLPEDVSRMPEGEGAVGDRGAARQLQTKTEGVEYKDPGSPIFEDQFAAADQRVVDAILRGNPKEVELALVNREVAGLMAEGRGSVFSDLLGSRRGAKVEGAPSPATSPEATVAPGAPEPPKGPAPAAPVVQPPVAPAPPAPTAPPYTIQKVRGGYRLTADLETGKINAVFKDEATAKAFAEKMGLAAPAPTTGAPPVAPAPSGAPPVTVPPPAPVKPGAGLPPEVIESTHSKGKKAGEKKLSPRDRAILHGIAAAESGQPITSIPPEVPEGLRGLFVVGHHSVTGAKKLLPGQTKAVNEAKEAGEKLRPKAPAAPPAAPVAPVSPVAPVVEPPAPPATGTAPPAGTAPVAPEPPAPAPTTSDNPLDRAAEIVLANGRGTASLLQREMGIGVGPASRLLGKLEEMGLVGPATAEGPRPVLLTPEQWAQKRNAPPAPVETAPPATGTAPPAAPPAPGGVPATVEPPVQPEGTQGASGKMPWDLTRAEIAAESDDPGLGALNDQFIYHNSDSGNLETTGIRPDAEGNVWASKGKPIDAAGKFDYAIDLSKIPPGQVVTTANGYPVIKGPVPKDAVILLGPAGQNGPSVLHQRFVEAARRRGVALRPEVEAEYAAPPSGGVTGPEQGQAGVPPQTGSAGEPSSAAAPAPGTSPEGGVSEGTTEPEVSENPARDWWNKLTKVQRVSAIRDLATRKANLKTYWNNYAGLEANLREDVGRAFEASRKPKEPVVKEEKAEVAPPAEGIAVTETPDGFVVSRDGKPLRTFSKEPMAEEFARGLREKDAEVVAPAEVEETGPKPSYTMEEIEGMVEDGEAKPKGEDAVLVGENEYRLNKDETGYELVKKEPPEEGGAGETAPLLPDGPSEGPSGAAPETTTEPAASYTVDKETGQVVVKFKDRHEHARIVKDKAAWGRFFTFDRKGKNPAWVTTAKSTEQGDVHPTNGALSLLEELGIEEKGAEDGKTPQKAIQWWNALDKKWRLLMMKELENRSVGLQRYDVAYEELSPEQQADVQRVFDQTVERDRRMSEHDKEVDRRRADAREKAAAGKVEPEAPAAPEKPKREDLVASGKIILGNKTTITLGAKTEAFPEGKIEGHWALVPARFVLPSHRAVGSPGAEMFEENEGYPQNLQPNRYTEPQTAEQARELLKSIRMDQELSARRLLVKGVEAGSGSPIINREGLGLAGANRLGALKFFFENKDLMFYDLYQGFLKEDAAQFGLEVTEGMKDEEMLLTRVVDINADTQTKLAEDFARNTNISTLKTGDAFSQADTLRFALPKDLAMRLPTVDEGGFAAMLDASGDLKKSILARIPPQDKAKFYNDRTNRFTPEGANILAKATLLELGFTRELIEDMAPGVRQSVEYSIPQLVRLAKHHGKLRLVPAFVDGLRAYTHIMNTAPEGMKPAAAINEAVSQDMLPGFGEKIRIDPAPRMIADFVLRSIHRNELGLPKEELPPTMLSGLRALADALDESKGIFGRSRNELAKFIGDELKVEVRPGADFTAGGTQGVFLGSLGGAAQGAYEGIKGVARRLKDLRSGHGIAKRVFPDLASKDKAAKAIARKAYEDLAERVTGVRSMGKMDPAQRSAFISALRVKQAAQPTQGQLSQVAIDALKQSRGEMTEEEFLAAREALRDKMLMMDPPEIVPNGPMVAFANALLGMPQINRFRDPDFRASFVDPMHTIMESMGERGIGKQTVHGLLQPFRTEIELSFDTFRTIQDAEGIVPHDKETAKQIIDILQGKTPSGPVSDNVRKAAVAVDDLNRSLLDAYNWIRVNRLNRDPIVPHKNYFTHLKETEKTVQQVYGPEHPMTQTFNQFLLRREGSENYSEDLWNVVRTHALAMIRSIVWDEVFDLKEGLLGHLANAKGGEGATRESYEFVEKFAQVLAGRWSREQAAAASWVHKIADAVVSRKTKGQANEKDAAEMRKLVADNIADTIAGIGNGAYVHFLGGSVGTPIKNLTQVVLQMFKMNPYDFFRGVAGWFSPKLRKEIGARLKPMTGASLWSQRTARAKAKQLEEEEKPSRVRAAAEAGLVTFTTAAPVIAHYGAPVPAALAVGAAAVGAAIGTKFPGATTKVSEALLSGMAATEYLMRNPIGMGMTLKYRDKALKAGLSEEEALDYGLNEAMMDIASSLFLFSKFGQIPLLRSRQAKSFIHLASFPLKAARFSYVNGPAAGYALMQVAQLMGLGPVGMGLGALTGWTLSRGPRRALFPKRSIGMDIQHMAEKAAEEKFARPLVKQGEEMPETEDAMTLEEREAAMKEYREKYKKEKWEEVRKHPKLTKPDFIAAYMGIGALATAAMVFSATQVLTGIDPTEGLSPGSVIPSAISPIIDQAADAVAEYEDSGSWGAATRRFASGMGKRVVTTREAHKYGMQLDSRGRSPLTRWVGGTEAEGGHEEIVKPSFGDLVWNFLNIHRSEVTALRAEKRRAIEEGLKLGKRRDVLVDAGVKARLAKDYKAFARAAADAIREKLWADKDGNPGKDYARAVLSKYQSFTSPEDTRSLAAKMRYPREEGGKATTMFILDELLEEIRENRLDEAADVNMKPLPTDIADKVWAILDYEDARQSGDVDAMREAGRKCGYSAAKVKADYRNALKGD